MKRLWVAPLGALLVAGCPASHLRPTGPPPEYEKPVLPAWEAAAPADPFESLGEGDWVDETGDQDAGADGPALDGAVPEAAPAAEAGVPEAGDAAAGQKGRPVGRHAGPAR